jgi:hypothetical protein
MHPEALNEPAKAVIKKLPAKLRGRRSAAPAGARRSSMRLRYAGRPTMLHKKVVDDLRKFNLELIKQPSHSHETNACDIGFWNMVRAMIAEHSDASPRSPVPILTRWRLQFGEW